jgi:UDP-N-acetylmuramoyl-L-alanyl-D-glutamate--2,6-diaminopimelate ligase
MKLKQILSQVKTDFNILKNAQFLEVEIEDIAIDSRLVKKNSVFFAIAGKENNGSSFIADAVNKGASVVISSQENDFKEIFDQQTLIISKNIFELLIEFLRIFYFPLPQNIYAVTGTNGKTSVAEFSRQIFQIFGKRTASIGTLGVVSDFVKSGFQISNLTTFDIVSNYKNLHHLKNNGVDDVFMEVSSIGLEQNRVSGLPISSGSFTNFTQDHLDYHKNMEEYFSCKMILFEKLLNENSFAVLNSDIEQFDKIKEICNSRKIKVFEYGFKAKDLKIEKIKQDSFLQIVDFIFNQEKYHFTLSVSGEFQVFNVLCALANLLTKNNLTQKQLTNLLAEFHSLYPAKGRMQKIASLKNNAQVFIDFAHSPDALENVLKLGRELLNQKSGKLIILFGCGGQRDSKKRPIMGKIASDFADLTIVTDDNPRNENAAKIREEIITACNKENSLEIADRKEAIKQSLKMLQPNDILILAGKGHENYQIIGDKKFEFDEEKIVHELLK